MIGTRIKKRKMTNHIPTLQYHLGIMLENIARHKEVIRKDDYNNKKLNFMYINADITAAHIVDIGRKTVARLTKKIEQEEIKIKECLNYINTNKI